MKLLGSTENKISKDKNGKNAPHLEMTEVIFFHCNVVNKGYQQNPRVFYTVVRKLFRKLLEIFTNKFYIFKDI